MLLAVAPGCGKEAVMTRSNPSEDEVLSLFEGADGALAPEREQAYWRSQLNNVELRVSDVYVTGEPIRFWYDLTLWVPAFAQVEGTVRAKVDGNEVKTVAAPISSAGYPDGAKLSIRRARIDNAVDLVALGTGEHELEVEFHLAVRQTRSSPFVAQLTGRTRTRIRVGEAPSSVDLVEVAEFATRLDARVQVQEGSSAESLLFVTVLAPTEVALAFRVELRRAAAVAWTGEFLVEPGATPSKQWPIPLASSLEPGDVVELAFIPDPALSTRDRALYGRRFAANRIVRSLTVEAFQPPRRP